MTVPESLFWNESTVRCISNALLERDADTLVSLVQMRLEEILPRIASKGLQSVTAEQVSQEIGHLLVDA